MAATNEPPVSSATRSDGASNDIRSHGTATTASVTAAAPTAASDTVGSAGLRAGPCSICSTLRTSEPGGVVPEAVNPAQGASGDQTRSGPHTYPHHRSTGNTFSAPLRRIRVQFAV